jgi:hypothetical protein
VTGYQQIAKRVHLCPFRNVLDREARNRSTILIDLEDFFRRTWLDYDYALDRRMAGGRPERRKPPEFSKLGGLSIELFGSAELDMTKQKPV